MRDQRDPQALGNYLLWCRAERSFKAPTLSVAYDAHAPEFWAAGGPFKVDGITHKLVPDYDGGGLMSNDPALHHSKTKQNAPVESDGGE